MRLRNWTRHFASNTRAGLVRVRGSRIKIAAIFLSVSAISGVLAAGLAGSVPVGVEYRIMDGQVQKFLVVNPRPVGAVLPCSCSQGDYRVALSEATTLYAEPDSASPAMVNLAFGQTACVLEERPDGWSKVELPFTCGQIGYAPPESFPVVRIQLLENGASPATPPVQTPVTGPGSPTPTVPAATALPATPTPTRTPTPVPAATQVPPAATATPFLPAPTPTPFGGGINIGGGLTVSQSLYARAVTVTGATNGLGTTNDEGTNFTVGVETTSGSTFNVNLALGNKANATLNGIIVLPVPAGTQIAALASDGVTGIARVGPDRWLFTISGSHANNLTDVTFQVKLPATLAPGFQTWNGLIRPFAG